MTSQADLLIGQEIDGYQIDKLLGSGGMARVYRGHDVRLGRYVAIKVIQPAARSDAEYARRFEMEARAVAQLDHPHIVRIYRFGEVGGLYYMAMQFVEGADLAFSISSYQARQELMPHDEMLRLMRHAASGLDYAHQRGVIHRDVKPANIMLDGAGRAIITDFGLALVQAEGTRGEIFGSPHYIAPEQAISSAGAVPQSDQYALGVILYEILTGGVPFNSDSTMQVAMMHMSDPLPPPLERNPSLHPAFVPVLEKVLSKDPSARYSTCTALVEALESAVTAAQKQPTSGSRLSMMRVAEQVQVYRDEHPLPPLPPAALTPPPVAQPSQPKPAGSVVRTAAAPTRAAPTRPITASAPPQRQLWTFVAAASALIVVAGIFAVSVLLNNRAGNAASTATAQSTPTENILPTATPDQQIAAVITPSLTPTIPTATFTSIPTATSIPTDLPTFTPLPPSALPVITVQNWTILLIGNDEALYVVNWTPDGAPPLSLEDLSFIQEREERGMGNDDDDDEDQTSEIEGDLWDADALASRTCVALIRENREVEIPVSCVLLTQEEVEGNQRFWREREFIIRYRENWEQTCTRDEVYSNNGCILSIPIGQG